jgi:chromosome segregation ATPase
MSDEQPNTPSDLGAAETVAPMETAAPTESAPAESAPVEYNWNGELPSLNEQDWFSGLDENVRTAITSGYERVRNNATAALHKHTTAQSQKSRQLDAAYEQVQSMQQRLAQTLNSLESASAEDATTDDRFKALEAGYKTQLESLNGRLQGFQQQLQQRTNDANQFYNHNRKLAEFARQLQGREKAVHDHYQGQLNEHVMRERQQNRKLQSELSQLRQLNEQYEAEKAVELFEQSVPHLKGDERYEAAMTDYYRLMQGLLNANPNATEADIKEMDAIIESRMLAKYPNRNPPATNVPQAETLASQPSGSGDSISSQLQLPSNKTTIF